MKIAFTIGAINRGGAETLLLDVMKRASQLPFDAMLIYRNGGDYETNFKATGQPCVYLRPKRGRYISYLWALRKVLRENKIDIVHAQYWLDAIYARIATIGLPIKLLTTFHGYTGAVENISLLTKVRYALSIMASDKVCFVSKYEQSGFNHNFNKWLGDKGCVVYNGVDFGKLDASYASLDTPLPIVNSAFPKLCMVGNFISERQHLMIIQALHQLKMCKSHLPVELYLIGKEVREMSNSYKLCVTYCSDFAMDYVHFLGGRGDVPALLQQMDGFVYATKAETFGIAVVEAMAAGLPVVVNNHPVMQEVTNDGKWATLFKSDDAKDCANKIQDLIENLPKRKAKAQEIAQQVRKAYSIEKHIERLNEIYTQI
ncbi:MAG: glycosyltransferase family 4 protein [Paludibacteraceae bacterium]|nr:glycosyltransferase family 4 protein [Paludibacteraceae bacterium]